MNIIINYDLIEYIMYSNQDLNPFKIIKHSFKHNKFFIAYTSIWAIKNLFSYPFGKALGSSLLSTGGAVTFALIFFTIQKQDPYKELSDEALIELCGSLKNIGIDTDFDLLKESKVDGKIYNFKLNEKKFPQIIESKYILIPSYNHNGEVNDTSVVQEHVMFSKEYIISKGTNQKKKVLAYSSI